MNVTRSTVPIQQKIQELETRLSKIDSLLIAFSGGIDSSFLLAVATSVVRKKTIALMTVSSSTPPEDEQHAITLAEKLNVALLKIQHDELAIPQYAANPKNRCYFCKDSLYAICKREAERLNLQVIADGINIDDLGDYRPGIQAATEYNIIHPLVEADFTKADIRRGSKFLGLSVWNKPASPCLSSRIPYGNAITKTMLSQIARGESALRAIGFKEVRLRHHGKIARIEIAREELELLSIPEIVKTIGKTMKAIGFDFVGLDVQGYKRGIFNENN
jgi:uncharacterized protein